MKSMSEQESIMTNKSIFIWKILFVIMSAAAVGCSEEGSNNGTDAGDRHVIGAACHFNNSLWRRTHVEEKVDVDERYPLARRAMRIALGQFIGSPDKSRWFDGQIKADVVVKPEAREEKNENIPEELKEQLRQLGYMK